MSDMIHDTLLLFKISSRAAGRLVVLLFYPLECNNM